MVKKELHTRLLSHAQFGQNNTTKHSANRTKTGFVSDIQHASGMLQERELRHKKLIFFSLDPSQQIVHSNDYYPHLLKNKIIILPVDLERNGPNIAYISKVDELCEVNG